MFTICKFLKKSTRTPKECKMNKDCDKFVNNHMIQPHEGQMKKKEADIRNFREYFD